MKIKKSWFDTSARIRELIEKHGVSKYALSKTTGISKSVISEWCNGKHQPSVGMIEKLCSGFGIRLSDFFRDDDEDVDAERTEEEMMVICVYRRLPDNVKHFTRYFIFFLDNYLHNENHR